jgi:hypothetical protein
MQGSIAAAASAETIFSPGGARFFARTRQSVSLGSLRVAIRSNEDPFAELQYFPEGVRLPHGVAVHYTVNCCNLSLDGPWPIPDICRARDTGYRGGRFAAGYYLTDHFGPSAYLMTRGDELWIFAPHFGSILWPFVVKYLLTIYSIDHQMLHLKAAAVSVSDSISLLIGRGGTGKTVLLTKLCQEAGAQFLSNTHVLVDEGMVEPIPTAMRVRNDVLFESIIAARELPRAIKTGEFLADPCKDLGWKIGLPGAARTICLLDYRERQYPIIRELDRSVLFNYMESFSLAASIYGLREDVLDYLDSDVVRFSTEFSLMKSRLRRLIDVCSCYYISCDATDFRNLEVIRECLASSA